MGRKRPRVSKIGHQILIVNLGYMWLGFYLQSFLSTPYTTVTYLNFALKDSFSDASTQHPHIVLRGSNPTHTFLWEILRGSFSTHTFCMKNTSWVVFDPYNFRVKNLNDLHSRSQCIRNITRCHCLSLVSHTP